MLFLLSDGSVSSIGQQNESVKHENSQLQWALRFMSSHLMHRMRMVSSQLFLASDEVLLKYHPPLIKTKGQGAEVTSHCDNKSTSEK